jgi:hypothetical protein
MQYFHRAHITADQALGFAAEFFGRRGFTAGAATPETASYTDRRGTIRVRVEVEGGHYTRVTAATDDVGESELDRVAKRFLAELHRVEEPRHEVRGAY